MTKKHRFIFLLILALGFFLRVYNLNWDHGLLFHPDERMILMTTEKLTLPNPLTLENLFSPSSSLNPKFFAYGSLPIYLLKLSAFFYERTLGAKIAISDLAIIGRFLSVSFEIVSLVLIYVMGKKIFSATVGLIASFIYAIYFFPIQSAHFFTVDPILNFMILLSIICLIDLANRPTFRQVIFAGGAMGMTLATKISGLLLALPLFFSLFVGSWSFYIRERNQIDSSPSKKFVFGLFPKLRTGVLLRVIIRQTAITAGVLFFTAFFFFLFQPYALLDWEKFYFQVATQTRMSDNPYVFPYTLQFVDTPAYWYPISNIFFWGIGPTMGFVALMAAIVMAGHYSRKIISFSSNNKKSFICCLRKFFLGEKAERDIQKKLSILLVFFSFYLGYFLLSGQFAVKFMRYYFPLYPFLAILSAWLIEKLWRRKNQLLKVFVGCLLAIHFVWLAAFFEIYRQPQSRVMATKWILDNIPPGKTIAVEHWDDRLPIAGQDRYHFVELPFYNSDEDPTKWPNIETWLAKTDYIVIASNRLYRPLQKLADCQKYPVCYPHTAEYYKTLFAEKGGFYKVADFIVTPKITIAGLNFSFPDQAADESFTVYDHPWVMIFKKNDIITPCPSN